MRRLGITIIVGLLAGVLGGTRAASAGPPGGPSDRARIEALFVLDSTGSMSGTIAEAKRRILAIAESIASGEPRPEVRFGVVTYRDRGDEYVTRRWPLSADWEETRAALTEIRAGGGGDTPESVVQALHEGIRETRWTLSPEVVKLVYLIGDAPPKIYDDDPDIHADLSWAAQNGVVVQSIGCGGLDRGGRDFFEEVARLTEGRYHGLTAAAMAVAPFEVRGAEEERPSRPRPADFAAVVSGTARTLSGERGVTYEEEAELEPVAVRPLAGEGDEPRAAASGLVGEHTRVVRDARTWRLLWAAHVSTDAAPVSPPAVDFSAEHVLVVSVAEGGVREILVGERADARHVRVLRGEDGPRVAMRRVPAFDGPVHFDTKGGAR